ncbi:MAG TPA: hypothetical protein VMH91_02185 [Candidatus Paceibacterota bacterium]|nr:hypothetical protein [Candidatus Paceibacterota bacterium]
MNALTSAQLLAEATPLPTWTREQKLEFAIDALVVADRPKPVIYNTVRDIENETLDLDTVPVARTIFEPIAKELNKHGIPTGPTLGAVMRSLELTRRQMHELACYCNEDSEVMLGTQAMQHLAHLIDFPDL